MIFQKPDKQIFCELQCLLDIKEKVHNRKLISMYLKMSLREKYLNMSLKNYVFKYYIYYFYNRKTKHIS